MVELIVNAIKIELPKNTDIKYTKQISDIFDLANVSVSHTNSFSFEKTPNNSQAMRQAGIISDNSTVPYSRNNASLKSDGVDLISQGWFKLNSTDDNYTGFILDGMVDFFKAIENKTLGVDLDLSNFEHEKLLETVIDSFTNEYYQYIIADYGGKLIFEEGINIDYLTPCFSVKKIWELIFSTFNFNCDYTNLSYLEGLYITYPKDIAEGQTDEVVGVFDKNLYVSNIRTQISNYVYPTNHYFWDSSEVTEGSLISNWKYIIPETTSYNFDLSIEMYAKYRYPSNPNFIKRNVNVSVNILKNGTVIGSIISRYNYLDEYGELRNIVFNQSCDEGDIIEVQIVAPVKIGTQSDPNANASSAFTFFEWHHNSTVFIISKTDLGTTKLQNELKDFSIKDFIKEIIWRTGLTPVYNLETNTVIFETLDSRINFSNATDLSNCYIKRTNEIYENDYAQKNIFKLKNNVDTDFTGDGYLYVPNVNLPDQKTIAQSKIYAPDKKIVTTNFFDIETNQYKIWQTEIKDDENAGGLVVDYKGLSGRFYFIRKNTKTGSFKLISEVLENEQVVSSIPVAINTNTLFEEAIYNNYSEYQKIFINFRIHYIDLAMTINDFLGLDMTKPVYFKKENAYYICNKITYQEGEKSKGEFIKINKI